RLDRVAPTVVVEILEQDLPGDLLALLDDPRHAAVVQLDHRFLARLAREAEAHGTALQLRVPIAQRGQPEGAVLTPILLVANADRGPFEERHDCCQHLRARQSALLEILLDSPPDAR